MNLDRLKEKLKELQRAEVKPRYFTTYNDSVVKRHLERFLETKGLCKEWSGKREGWVIDCPGEGMHNHRPRRDDCTVYMSPKGNGFYFISGRCRHDSCMGSLQSYIQVLNEEWGNYLNEVYNN